MTNLLNTACKFTKTNKNILSKFSVYFWKKFLSLKKNHENLLFEGVMT